MTKLQISIHGAALQRQSCNATSMVLLAGNRASMELLAGDRAATQHRWCCSPVIELQRNIHGSSTKLRCNNQWCFSPATKLQQSDAIHGSHGAVELKKLGKMKAMFKGGIKQL